MLCVLLYKPMVVMCVIDAAIWNPFTFFRLTIAKTNAGERAVTRLPEAGMYHVRVQPTAGETLSRQQTNTLSHLFRTL